MFCVTGRFGPSVIDRVLLRSSRFAFAPTMVSRIAFSTNSTFFNLSKRKKKETYKKVSLYNEVLLCCF